MDALTREIIRYNNVVLEVVKVLVQNANQKKSEIQRHEDNVQTAANLQSAHALMVSLMCNELVDEVRKADIVNDNALRLAVEDGNYAANSIMTTQAMFEDMVKRKIPGFTEAWKTTQTSQLTADVIAQTFHKCMTKAKGDNYSDLDNLIDVILEHYQTGVSIASEAIELYMADIANRIGYAMRAYMKSLKVEKLKKTLSSLCNYVTYISTIVRARLGSAGVEMSENSFSVLGVEFYNNNDVADDAVMLDTADTKTTWPILCFSQQFVYGFIHSLMTTLESLYTDFAQTQFTDLDTALNELFGTFGSVFEILYATTPTLQSHIAPLYNESNNVFAKGAHLQTISMFSHAFLERLASVIRSLGSITDKNDTDGIRARVGGDLSALIAHGDLRTSMQRSVAIMKTLVAEESAPPEFIRQTDNYAHAVSESMRVHGGKMENVYVPQMSGIFLAIARKIGDNSMGFLDTITALQAAWAPGLGDLQGDYYIIAVRCMLECAYGFFTRDLVWFERQFVTYFRDFAYEVYMIAKYTDDENRSGNTQLFEQTMIATAIVWRACDGDVMVGDVEAFLDATQRGTVGDQMEWFADRIRLCRTLLTLSNGDPQYTEQVALETLDAYNYNKSTDRDHMTQAIHEYVRSAVDVYLDENTYQLMFDGIQLPERIDVETQYILKYVNNSDVRGYVLNEDDNRLIAAIREFEDMRDEAWNNERHLASLITVSHPTTSQQQNIEHLKNELKETHGILQAQFEQIKEWSTNWRALHAPVLNVPIRRPGLAFEPPRLLVEAYDVPSNSWISGHVFQHNESTGIYEVHAEDGRSVFTSRIRDTGAEEEKVESEA